MLEICTNAVTLSSLLPLASVVLVVVVGLPHLPCWQAVEQHSHDLPMHWRLHLVPLRFAPQPGKRTRVTKSEMVRTRFDSSFQSNWIYTPATYIVYNAIVRITKGRHKELIPEGCSIRLVVENTNGTVGSSGNRFPNDIHRLGLRSGTLEESTVPSQDLLRSVSSKFVESRSGKDNGVVWETWIGQYKVLLTSRKTVHELKVRSHQRRRFGLFSFVILNGRLRVLCGLIIRKERTGRATLRYYLLRMFRDVVLDQKTEPLIFPLETSHLFLQRL